VAGFDVFVSYSHADRERVVALRDALTRQGLEVWLDEPQIETFASIAGSIENGLACSKALVAYYSHVYPTRRPCQWELTAAFLAAQREGDPRRRVLVVNPEEGAGHVEPVELRDALFAAANDETLARRIAEHVRGLDGELGELGMSDDRAWFGRRPVGAAHFVGRVRDMWGVHSALTASEIGLITGARGDPALKVTGMGGIGKSLLAQEYALRFAAAYPGGVFWLAAHGHDDTGEGLSGEGHDAERTTQLLGFATDLGIDTAQLSPEQVAGALVRELDARGERFLWVVDDLPSELSIDELERWVAPGRCGRTLLTTRSRAYGAVGEQIDLGLLSAQEGFELLATHRPPDGPVEEQAARGLVDDLGCHALALDVAGAALHAERGVRSYAAYRTALADPGADELELAANLADELPGGHDRSITTTLARSIRGLDKAGLDFLRLASRLAVDAIPPDLVIDIFAAVDELDQNAARRRAVAAMYDASSRSLAEITDDGAYQVHALISRTIRLLEPASRRAEELADTAATALSDRLFAAADERVAADSATLAHARHLAAAVDDQAQAALLHAVAHHDYDRGDYRSARALQERAMDVMRRLLGEEHLDTLSAMNNLAETLRAQGELDRARDLGEQVLDVTWRMLGDEHPHTLTSMNNLASTLSEQGDLTGARELQERVVDVRWRVLGDEHPATLTAMNNLANTLSAQGDSTGARELHERVVDVMRQVRGDEHPDTLGTMINLAEMLRAQGDLERARDLQERAMDGMRRVRGQEHLDTLSAMNNLAETLRAQGDLDRARDLGEQVLDVMRRILGDEHPHTLTSMNNLAGTLSAQGDLTGARELQKRVVDVMRRVLSDEHPGTITAISNLANTLSAQGDLTGARELQKRVVDVMRRVVGDEHSDTLIAMSNLADTLQAQGDLAGARDLHKQVLDVRWRVLGEEHPDTLTSMNNLALTLAAQDDLTGARVLEERILETSQRILGDEHPHTLTSMNNLANVLVAQGDLAGARDLHKQVLGARRRMQGKENPDRHASN
jgi:hypothetical protein